MKKKIIIIIGILFVLMLIPIPMHMKDGGSVTYKAILYEYTKIHRLSEISSTGYITGWELKVLGRHVGGVENINVIAVPIEVIKKEKEDANKFNIYVENSERNIYLANNILEIYYYNNTKGPLKYYLENTFQTIDDGIKHITDNMENTETLRDGGTKIYKSIQYDLTIVICNTIQGSKNIFIGDYDMQFDNSSMCKRGVNNE